VLETIVSGAISPFCIFFTNTDSAIGPTVFEPPKNPRFIKYQSADIDLLLAKNQVLTRNEMTADRNRVRHIVACTETEHSTISKVSAEGKVMLTLFNKKKVICPRIGGERSFFDPKSPIGMALRSNPEFA
jgi:hypothetical protein